MTQQQNEKMGLTQIYNIDPLNAACNGHVNVLEFLSRNGPQDTLTQPDNNGATPLHIATQASST